MLLLFFTGQNIPTRLYKRVIVILYWSEYPDEVISFVGGLSYKMGLVPKGLGHI